MIRTNNQRKEKQRKTYEKNITRDCFITGSNRPGQPNAFVNGGFENGTLNSWTQNGGFVSTGPVYFPDGSNNNAVVTRTRRSEK